MSAIVGIRTAIQISPKGDVAAVGNQGGNTGDIDTINVIDLKAKAPRIVHSSTSAKSSKVWRFPMMVTTRRDRTAQIERQIIHSIRTTVWRWFSA